MGVFDLTGRKALVTGGARGLGAEMAQALARAGAAVMIGDVLEEQGRRTAQELTASGATAGFVALDVTDDDSWAQAVGASVTELGGLDILINNAGVEISSLLVDLEPKDVRLMLDVNLLGVALGLKHGFRAMRPTGAAGQGGAIINVSSVAATIAFPGIAGYSATKSGVDRLTRVAALESGKARLWRPGELHLPGPGGEPNGHAARPGHGEPWPLAHRGISGRRRHWIDSTRPAR